MIKIKSISKRVLAVILATMMLLTSGIVGTLAANVDFVETGAYTELAETGGTLTSGSRVFLKVNSNWKTDNARFAVYFFYKVNGQTKAESWYSMITTGTDDIYYADIPSGTWTGLIFVRMNPNSSDNNWNNKWNQTADLTTNETNKNLYTISDWGNGSWSAYQFTSNAKVTASPTTVNKNSSVTLSSSLTSYTGYNTISSVEYSSDKAGTFNNATFTPTVTGTHTISAKITYYAKGFTSISKTTTVTTNITVTDPAPGTPTVSTTSVTGATTITGAGGTANRYRIPVGTDYTINLSASATNATGYKWDGVAGTATKAYNYTAPTTPGESSHTYTVKATNTAGESSETTYTIYVEYYDYFKAGDKVYLDCQVDGGTGHWEYDAEILMYVRENDGTEGNATKPTSGYKEMTKIGDRIYQYEITAADEAEYIEKLIFWRGKGTSAMWNYLSTPLAYTDYNAGTYNGVEVEMSGSTTAQPNSLVKITDLALSTTINVGEPIIIGQASEVTTGDIVLNYKRDGADVTTAATDVNYSYKVGGVEKSTDATFNWTPESTGEATVSLDMTLKADTSITGSAVKNVTAADNELTVSVNENIAGIGTIIIGTEEVANGESTIVDYNESVSYSISVPGEGDYRIAGIKFGTEVIDISDNNATSWTAYKKLTADTVIEVTYAKKLVNVTVNEAEGGTAEADKERVELDGTVTVTATPDTDNFYVFDKWIVTGATITDAQASNSTLTIEGVRENLTITPSFKLSDTGYITPSVNYANRGTVTPEGEKRITLNTAYELTATPNTGYKLTGWTVTGGTEDTDYTITENGNKAVVKVLTKDTSVSVVAHFAGVEGTVNFSASDGGSVNKTTQVVTYDSYASATATANEGNNFVNWTITGGTKGTDYELVNYTESSTTINIRPLKDGVTINAKANFAAGYEVEFYYLSANGFNKIKIDQYKNTTTNNIHNGYSNGSASFGDVEWYTTGNKELLVDYNTDIKAQMSMDAGTSSGGGLDIYVKFNSTWNEKWNWDGGYQLSVTCSTNADRQLRTGNTAGCDEGYGKTYWPGGDTWIGAGTKLSDQLYKWTIPSTALSDLYNYGFVVWSKDVEGDSDINEVNASRYYYGSAKNKAFYDANNYFELSSNYVETNSSTSQKNVRVFDLTEKGLRDTDTNEVSIKNALYKTDGTWAGNDKVWLYDNGTTIVATTRSALATLVTSNASLAQSQNAHGYTKASWDAFDAAYTTAKSVLGAGASNQTAIDNAVSALEAAIEGLEDDPNVVIYATDGTVTGANGYLGRISFVGYDLTESSYTLDGTACDFYTLSVTRNTPIEIKCKVENSDYMCAGFVINGTKFAGATLDPADATNTTYRASYAFENGGDVIPVYFKKYIFNDDGTLNTSKAIRVYTKYDPDSFSRWGSYIAAYTWTETNGGYMQMGIWPGQLMIPENDQKGVYYTYVERESSGATVKGITFDNYGYKDSNNNCALINDIQRVQAYDYYEFVQLANGDTTYDNITFTFKQSPNTNAVSKSSVTLADYNFVDYTNQNGDVMDIQRRTEGLSEDVGLYIVRHGVNDSGSGAQSTATLDGQFYIDCYLYSPTGTYLGYCKSYMLLTPDKVNLNNGQTLADYAGNKRVMVDYQGMTGYEVDGGNAYRFDGEWYGYNNDQKVTLNTKVALLSPEDNRTYTYQDSVVGEINGIGSAYVNGSDTATVEIKEGTAKLSATPEDGYMFCGWYIMADNGSIDVVDPNTEMPNTTVNLNFSYTYVALYYPIPEGLLVVNNYCYMIDPDDIPDDEEYAEFLPPVQGGEMEYAQRTVKLVLTKTDGTTKTIEPNDYTANTLVELGDKVDVYIITTPMYQDDYVYAWYEKIYDENGKVNFEEVGPGAELTHTPKQTETYHFTININSKEDIKTYTIYTDVYHASSEVILRYEYQNRFNTTVTYTVTYNLTAEEYSNNMTPEYEVLQEKAPFVDDLYKDVFWKITDGEYTKDGKVITITAEQPDTFEVNLIADGEPYETITKKFNESISIDAREIDPNITNLQGVWFVDENENQEYDDGKDQILAYGSYYGFVVTGDATICYDSTEDARTLGYKAILEEAIYGREQSNSADGTTSIDKIYVDYIIRYLVPKFDKDEEPDGTILNDEVNTNATPVQFDTLIDAGYEVDYGLALEYINTIGPDAGTDAQKNNFTKLYGTDKTDTSILQALLDKMGEKAPTYGGNGSLGTDGKLGTYFYIYSAKNQGNEASNKNRLLMTFSFTNNETNCNKYYNVIAYLKLTDKNGNVSYVFSNQGTLNIKETADKNADDIIYGTINP